MTPLQKVIAALERRETRLDLERLDLERLDYHVAPLELKARYDELRRALKLARKVERENKS